MAVSLIVTNILKIVVVILAGHVTLTKIIPMMDELLKGLIKENKVVDNFTSLLGVFVFVLVGMKIVDLAVLTENKVISYLSILKPGLELIHSLVPYFGYVFAGAVVIIAVRGFKK